jgi:hypothetical protein
MKPTKPAESAVVAKEHLVRLLLEQLDRTFSTDGQEAGLRSVGDLLRRLDATELREYAYRHGLITEYDLEPEQEPDRTRASEGTE